MKKNRIVWTALIVVSSVLAVVLNHSSIDIGYYAPESEHQSSALERGKLVRVGSFVAGGNMDGSVVPPSGLANDLRTFAIDGILVIQAVALSAAVRRRSKSDRTDE